MDKMDNEESAHNDQHHLEVPITVSSNNERSISPPTDGLDTVPENVSQIKVETPFNESMTSLANTNLKTKVDDTKGTEDVYTQADQYKKDYDLQQTKVLMDSCVMNMKESWSASKVKDESTTQSGSQTKMEFLCSADSLVGENSTNDVQDIAGIMPPLLLKQLSSPVKIITSPSDQNGDINFENYEGLIWGGTSVVQDDLEEVKVKTDDVVNETAQGQSDRSTVFDIPEGGNIPDEVITEGKTASIGGEMLLLTACEDIGRKMEINVVSPKTIHKQIGAKLKHYNDNFQKKTLGILPLTHKLLHKREKNSQIVNVPTVKDHLDSQESLEEIDLKEDSDNPGLHVQAIGNVVKDPTVCHVQSKYGEIRKNCSSTIDFLKFNLVKGVIAQGTKIKEVVNEKLNMLEQSQELTHESRSDAPNSDSNYMNRTTKVAKPQTEAPFLFTVDNNPILKPVSNDRVDSTYPTPNTTTYINSTIKDPSLVSVTNVSKGNDPNFKPTTPPASIPRAQFIGPNMPLFSSNEPAINIVTSTIAQSPGPLRGYTALYHTPYGVHVPPSLPPPPQVTTEDYFASRSYHSRYYNAPPTCPAPSMTETNRMCYNTAESQGSKFTQRIDNMTSFVRRKSNEMRDDLSRKLSSPVSQLPRTNPLADSFADDGRVQRSSMDSGSDQFYDHGFRTVTTDDFLKGALCCCCWPLGLAARVFTMTMPDHNGPVDSCIKAMSQQMSSMALLLGIATYFVLFLLWFSLLFVAAKFLQNIIGLCDSTQ